MTRLDLRGLRCPWPVVRAAAVLRDVDAVVVLADDPATGGELAALAAARGWSCRTVGHGEYRLARSSVTDC